ncbi:MAG: pyruvate dehydrogenase [Planctomycetes bacterium]|jgi:pyruvate dehydrogenase E2 component (dihydrolipoamide acetyltransferase)|nr:pyruvate dehydrogenase [Planctomycetota bacterium]
MALEFKLPDIGEGIAEGEIVKWMVAVGDVVEEHQPIVEVMTDKATVELPAPQPGTITEIRAGEGDVIPVGQVIFVLDGAGATSAPAPAPTPATEAAVAPEAASPPGEGRTVSFKLPDIGEGIAEGEIVQWMVAEGTAVEEHQPVVEVMTDKATVEIPAPAAGVIQKILAQAGDVVPIGTVIFELQAGSGARAAVAATSTVPAAAVAVAAPVPSVVHGSGKVRAVPSARRVARELSIDLTQVSGSGRGGIIRRADVEAFHKSGASAQPTAPVSTPASGIPAKPSFPSIALPVGDRETRVPFRGVRRKIAEAMARSKYTATHFTVVEELDVTDLIKIRAQAKEIGAKDGIKVTYMPFIMKAVASGLFRFPELNSQLDEATNEIVTYHYVNLGIAIDTAQGLIVPVVKDVQSKGVLQLASELSEIAERTRSGKIKPEELSGGTFTITNAGNIGGILATPIINFPEVGILGVNRIMKRPGVVETPEGDSFEVRHYMNLSISVDHRLVDGASATRFLVYLRQVLENPGLLSL